MGWFDANPAHLWEYPPVEAATRYVHSIGGIERTITLGVDYAEGRVDGEKDFRFAATLLSHAVFCNDENHLAQARARVELAKVFRQLGYGAENATWRNFYLTGAKELTGVIAPALNVISPESFMDLSIQQLTDTWAIRIRGPDAGVLPPFTIDLVIHYTEEKVSRYSGWHMNMSNGALTGYEFPARDGTLLPLAGLTIWLTHEELVKQIVAAHQEKYPGLAGLEHVGDDKLWGTLARLVEIQDPGFAIVTPHKLTAK
jgi:alkyl sulfatase BDS1-like metallo-beta-lactamase superfamily hydrolase